MKKAIGKRLLALLLVVLMLCPQTYALAATDLSGHWCRGEIEAFLSKDLVRGYPDGGFHPDATVTRAEFIRMVNSTFGFVREGTATFTDVKEGDWYSADLAAAARTGWFSGMPDGSALPQATITRQEAAKLLVSMLEEKRPGSFAMFTDGHQVADWARDYVETAGALGIIEGFPDGTYRPTRYLTRAETVKMLSNIAQQIYSAAGIYHTDRVERSAVVLCGAVTLRGAVIKGNLYVSESCAGSLDLTDCTVEGSIVILGAAARAVTLRGSSVREILLRSDAANTEITVGSGSKVDLITANAPASIEVAAGGFVHEVRSNAAGTNIHGSGTVELITANEPTLVRGSTLNAGSSGKMNGTSAGTGTGSIPGGAPGGDTPTPQPPAQQKYALSAGADKDNYNINEENRVSGQVTCDGEGLSGVPISMVIRFPEEDVRVMLDETASAEDGSFSFNFVLPASSVAGVYEIRITAGKPVRQSVVLSITVAGQVTVDKAALEEMIEKAEGMEQDKYTSDSWAALSAELARAKSVYSGSEATQAEVDAQTEALAQAIGALVLRADKSALRAAIDKASGVERSKYTQESLKALDRALEDAERVYEDDNATNKEVAQSTDKLLHAIEALEEKGAMEASLKLNGSDAPASYRALLGEAKSFPNNGDSLIWLTEGAGTGTLKVTLQSSDESILKPDAVADGTMSAAITAEICKPGAVEVSITSIWGNEQQSGKLAVTVVNEATVSVLRKAIEDGRALDAKDFKEEGFAAFTAALDDAQKALDNVSSTEAQLAAAAKTLGDARAALKNINWSDIKVTITEQNRTEALTEYTVYQGYSAPLCVVSDTSADKVNKISFAGETENAFDIQVSDWGEKNRKNFTLYANELGTHTLTVTVSFTDGTYTEASIAITAVEKVDTTALRAAINKAKTLVESNYSEGWEEFQTALSEAQAVLKLRITTQETVDDATKKLNDAMAALVVKKVDVTNLEVVWYQGAYSSTDPVPETVHTAKGKSLPDTGFYWLNVKGLQKNQVTADGVSIRSTDETVVIVDRSIEGAGNENPYIYRQRVDFKVVGEGTAEIVATVTLVDGTEHQASFTVISAAVTDKSALNALIAEAEALKAGDYTAESWKAFEAALESAKTVAADSAAGQSEVDEAEDKLQSAMNALEKATAADKTALNALIAEAEALEANDYSTSSWKAMQTALASARKLSADASATQQQVDAAAKTLREKIDALAGRASVDDIKARLDIAGALSSTLYTAESWQTLQQAVTDAQKVAEAGSDDIKTVNAAYDTLTRALYSLIWADTVTFKTFTGENAPVFVYGVEYGSAYFADKNAKETFAENGTAWESELDGAKQHSILGGIAVTPYASKMGWYYSSLQDISLDEMNAALLAQCETLVMETTDDEGKTVNSRYLVYLPVNDGVDRTVLHAAVESTRGLDASAYTLEQWADVQTALTNARAVYADKASAQQEINEAAKALSDAVAAASGGDAPITGEIKDIGLTYGDGGVSIMGDPGEYSDASFQVVAGEYQTELADTCGYNMNDWGDNGYAEMSDEMWNYIETHCKKDGKYVVTIKLYRYNKETKEFTPYIVDGKQVEFQVYVTK